MLGPSLRMKKKWECPPPPPGFDVPNGLSVLWKFIIHHLDGITGSPIVAWFNVPNGLSVLWKFIVWNLLYIFPSDCELQAISYHSLTLLEFHLSHYQTKFSCSKILWQQLIISRCLMLGILYLLHTSYNALSHCHRRHKHPLETRECRLHRPTSHLILALVSMLQKKQRKVYGTAICYQIVEIYPTVCWTGPPPHFWNITKL